MKKLKLFEDFNFKEEDFDYEEEAPNKFNNDEYLKNMIIKKLMDDGYYEEEAIEQVENAQMSLFNDIVKVVYKNNAIDHWHIEDNKLKNHF